MIAFLSRPDTYGRAILAVDRVETHISIVFLTGDRAYKLKRAVRFPYLDFSTPALRAAACEAEVALNRRTAPDVMVRRVGERRRNASDATADVVERQVSYDLGVIEWDRVDSSGSRQDTMRKVTAAAGF